MTESEQPVAEAPQPQGSPGKALAQVASPERVSADTASMKAVLGSDWVQRRGVKVVGVALIVAALIWRAQILSHLYFRQDDFRDLILAVKSPLNWHYLSFIGAGHFMIGQRLLFWLVTRGSLYNWTLASVIILALFACAALAAFRLLRTLFGEHPAILISLAVFLLSPLTVPSFDWWSSATETLPVVLAIFMALNAHVMYVRRGQTRQLVAAACWVAFGLLFYEKALILPLLLFAMTALYFTGRRSVLAGARLALVRYRKAWLAYAAILVVYSILLAVSLRTTIAPPQTPHSFGAVVTFCWDLLRNTLIPGLIGGPWRWLPISGGTYAIGAPPSGLTWLAMIAALVLIAASVIRRKTAWRSWTIWIGWVALADMAPVVVRRINGWSPALYALDTRFVADSVAVLIICMGLAFLPLVPEQRAAAPALSWAAVRSDGELVWRRLAAGVLVVFAIGTIATTQSYTSHVSGSFVASYIANARQALHLAPPGTLTLDGTIPGSVFVGPVRPALASSVIGDMAPGRLRWISVPTGTIDGLRVFGPDGRLHLAKIEGGVSPWGNPCYAVRRGHIKVNFWTASPAYSNVLRIGYLWYSRTPGTALVRYGTTTQGMSLTPGLHSGYLTVSGSAPGMVVQDIKGGGRLCIGDAGAGFLVPDEKAPTLPRAPTT